MSYKSCLFEPCCTYLPDIKELVTRVCRLKYVGWEADIGNNSDLSLPGIVAWEGAYAGNVPRQSAQYSVATSES
jgi:hypothetical protein